ncbi:MAG: response regulator [Myxococcota bacterium]
MSAHVLVIDDSQMTLDLVVRALRSAGYTTEGAADLASLDAALAKTKFDLVLVDVNMPEMYGDDVVEFLRTQRKLSSKLVLYSDIAETELAAKAKAVGADGYICKSKGLESAVANVGKLTAPAGESAQTPTTRKKRVLIVDDSETVALLLQSELSAKGLEVFTADTADKATKIILKKQTRPDLVLLDVRMPNVNGEQFCRFIKGNTLFRGIKVLLCSGEDEAELKRICREAGADGYVTKDSVLSKITETVRTSDDDA